MSSPTSRSEGRVSVRPSPAIPSSTARPPGRQSWVASSTATGAPAVSTTRSSSAAAGVAVAREDDLGGAERARELELLLADAVGDDPRRRVQRAAARSPASRACPTPITPTASPGCGPRLLEAVQDDRRRLDEHAGVEGDVVGQAVHDLLGHRDELGVAARPREPERLDALAPLRLAAAAAAGSDGRRSSPRRRRGRPTRTDVTSAPTSTTVPAHSWPGMTGKRTHRGSVNDAGHHLDVGPAQARLAAADEDVAGPHGRRLHLPVGDRVGSLDDDRLHAESYSTSGERRRRSGLLHKVQGGVPIVDG